MWCSRIVGSLGTLAPGEAPQAVAQVELAVLGAAGHSPEVAARRADGLAFGGDHRDCSGRLVASHGLAGIDPRRSADAELLAESVGGFDEIGPAGRGGKNVKLARWTSLVPLKSIGMAPKRMRQGKALRLRDLFTLE